MTTITIPKKLIKNDDLIIIPRKEYEKILDFRFKKIEKEVELTSVQKRTLIQARKNLSKGQFLTMYELKQKLGVAN